MFATALSFLTSKIAGPIFGIASGVLAATLIVVWLADASQIKSLHKEIDDPKTGYAARLVNAQVDSSICRGAVADQNAALDRFAASQNGKLTEAAKAIAAADAHMVQVGAKVSNILSAKPGADECASADALILGSLQ